MLHTPTFGPHAPPAGTMGTHVEEAVPASGASEDKQERPGLHTPPVAPIPQSSPASSRGTQVPQAWPTTRRHAPLLHCPENAHDAPVARDPVAGPHADGTFAPARKSAQLQLGYAVLHASSVAVVSPVDGAARRFTQDSVMRVTHVPWSPYVTCMR
jgi:hypothetical protein